MDFEYRPVSDAARQLLTDGHQNSEMAAILVEIAAKGVTLLPENTDGEREDIGDLTVTHRFVDAPGESETIGWHFVEAGMGEPLVLMHGIPQSWHMWTPVLSKLAKHFRCIAIDLKGYGQSHKERGDFRHEGVAEQVIALLDMLGVDRFNLFSHDRGTVQADFIAAKHAERVIPLQLEPEIAATLRALSGLCSLLATAVQAGYSDARACSQQLWRALYVFHHARRAMLAAI